MIKVKTIKATTFKDILLQHVFSFLCHNIYTDINCENITAKNAMFKKLVF